ncbi:DNA polymerase epsilon catalytic subunit A [Ceratocystis platani]|uniref:DNA polymerase epsilon catalytic subunit n=1 Tax=Ceratocystis fimbriata f. sp. platani TaxID=88771 RepID=A0A0F8CTV6_CERFI|nr:DNA polymerase epsilon catalytic subunit A [Ceratocystis platani]
MGFERIESGKRKEGWLVNVQPTSIPDDRNVNGRAALDCYFIEDGNESTFKATVEYKPYMLIAVRKGRESEVEEWVKRIDGGGVVNAVAKVEKEDLTMPNHLLGYRRTFLKLTFVNVFDLMTARREIMPIAERNRKNMNAMDAYADVVRTTGELDLYDDSVEQDERGNANVADASDYIVDIREYDVPYHVRVMIDLDIRVGRWYFIDFSAGVTTLKINEERLAMADPVVMAYDIETCKSPLKFPDSSVDQIMMISYMIDGQGFLITNREIVSEDIADFDYTPKPEYPGVFIIFNEPNERALIERFFEHIKISRPTVIATYNGDFFDWPYVEARAAFNGIDMYQEIGWKRDSEDQFKCNYGVHMDCFHWVNRDSYLPQGSRGLKAVTVAKLGYDPDELDPELMTPYASERPQTLAEYSVSDAVATYYLYMKYVQPFIFSLCTILPLSGDDTLRKGTATFPENFSFKLKNGKKVAISYPCVMLNHLVHAKFTNHQYQTLVDPATFKYETHSDNSIFFEVDGPYKAMVIPTSKEEDKNLKKRYAVFNDDGSLAELKGFEVKRRGELKLIKIFQQQIFKFFLEGATLAECYGAVSKVANRWLDVLYNKGSTLSDEELMDLISENRSMSKTLEEYGSQKSTSITTAKRLADFLGEGMVKDKGLNCKFIISYIPRNAPVTERAVPVAIFSAPEETKRLYLRKWLKEDPASVDPRALLDWSYYLERLGSVIQKLITIPAALQKVRNPVPRVTHPDWLQRRINQKDDKMKQKKLSDMFTVKSSESRDDPVNRLVDVEDYGNQLAKAKTIGAAFASSQVASSPMPKRKAPERDETPVLEDLPKKMPDPSEDYIAFLMYQKRKWKMQKEARGRRRQLFGDRRMNNNNNSIQQTMMRQAHSTFTNTWQILHLKATDSPGIVMAYVLIDAKIHPVKINVPRQLYVNFKTKSIPELKLKDCSIKPANVTLPSGHLPVNLVQLTMSEESYVTEMQKWFPLLNDRTVEGVYEQKLPLNMRALLQLGNSCTIDQSQEAVLGKGLERGFDLSGLKQPEKKRNYLESVPLAFIYISQITTGDKQIYGIFSSRAEQAHIVILQRSRETMQDIPNISRIYEEKLREHVAEVTASNGSIQDFFQFQEKLTFKVTQVTTQRKAHLEIGDVVKKMHKEELRAQVLVIQSSQRESLIHNIPILGEFPTLPMKYDVYDGSLPPLGWQPVAVRRLVRHYLRLAGEITHFMALARYADIPLCNLEKEDPRFLIDVSYARRLQANNVALWWSADARPDHGGYEKDNIAGPLDMMAMPQVNHPGTYLTVCIEMEVRNLAINTILTSSLINALEGSEGEMFNADPSTDKDGTGILYSHNSFSGAGIRVLRGMVKSWWSEACRGSPMADLMVNHLLRWVEDPDSYLYDNTLHRYVQLICRKAFQQLMGDFRRVGCQVIFANSSRLILQTTKQDVETAYAFGQYITKSIKTQPLFHFIDLDIKEYWDYLVWYDEYNYGGVGCEEIAEHEGTQELNTVMHWQMQTFLPPRLQSVFGDWVVEFIRIMHNLKRPNAAVSGTPRMTQIPIHNLTADPESTDLTNIISGPVFEKPLKKEIASLITRQKREMMHPELAADYAFPNLPGSHISGLDSHKAILELVKAIMQILSLDKNIIMEARLLRKELLQMFDISDFSTAGAFRNPSESLVLRDISCENCAMPREFDFCRDEDLLPEDLSQGAGENTWRCTGCGFEFSRMRIEERLIAAVESYVIEWTTQDQKCKVCGAVKLGEFMDHCTCSGEWKNMLSRDDIVDRLKVYKNVAEFYDMRMLYSVVGEILSAI